MGWERLTKKKMGSVQQSAKETLRMVAEERAEKETAERDIYTKQDRKDIGSLGRERRERESKVREAVRKAEKPRSESNQGSLEQGLNW